MGTILNGVGTEAGLRRPKCSAKVSGPALFLTSRPQPHYTIAAEAKGGRWFIYEVDPIGKIDISDDWDEYIVRAARITRFVRRVKPTDPTSAVYKRPYIQDRDDYSDTVKVDFVGDRPMFIKQKTVRR